MNVRHKTPTASARAIPSVDETIVEFERPPVSEVIFGIGFQEPNGFREPHFGLFWDQIRREFPNSEVREPIVPLAQEGVQFEFVPAPKQRHFFRTADGSQLVQVQSNRFLYNWIKTQETEHYPRYGNVYPRFLELKRAFGTFLEAHGFGSPIVRELRLEYLNHIPKGAAWKSPADVQKLFPDFRLQRRGRSFLLSPLSFNIVVRYPMDRDGTRLDVSLRTGLREVQEVISLQLSVIGRVESPSENEMQQWFDRARLVIDRSFVDLSSKQAQRIWGMHAS